MRIWEGSKLVLDQSSFGDLGGKRTGGMIRFQNPVRIFGICDSLSLPFDLQVAGCFLEERGSRKVLDVQLGFWWHFDDSFFVSVQNEKQ